MDHALLVRIAQTRTDAPHDLPARLQRRLGIGLALQPLIQRLTVQQLHGHVGVLAVVIEVVDGHDIRMGETLCADGLALQRHAGIGVLLELLAQHLERNEWMMPVLKHLTVAVPRLEYRPHAAVTELLHQGVTSVEHASRHQHGVGGGCH